MNQNVVPERLSSLDEWGDRKYVVPAPVRGKWRNRRQYVQAFLLLFFLILPWTSINGLQTIWLDIPARRFVIFGRVFLAHDTPLLFFIVALVLLTLSLVTALWGRVWCGWACPQTVFIEVVYRRIESWFEGDYIQRRRLKATALSLNGLLRKSGKWLAFLLVSAIFAHSFIAYFAGAKNLLQMTTQDPSGNWGYFLLAMSVTSLVAFDFGWFREQFCIIMCPYGRFQSVLMDENSLTVSYNQLRGEPRRGVVAPSKKSGDCISCNRCVEVCPTGIDIRNGSQLECIGCTACIDACNEIMTKVKKPENLISYSRQNQAPAHFFRPRILINVFLIVVLLFGLGFGLRQQNAFYATLLRGKDKPYEVLPNGAVMNHFKLHFQNQSQDMQEVSVTISQDGVSKGIQLVQTMTNKNILAGHDQEFHFFTTSPSSLSSLAGAFQTTLEVRDQVSKKFVLLPIVLLGPVEKSP